MNFKPGQRVVCVRAEPESVPIPKLELNRVYTVRAVGEKNTVSLVSGPDYYFKSSRFILASMNEYIKLL